MYCFQFRKFILIALRFLFNAFTSEYRYLYDCVVADCGALSVSAHVLVIVRYLNFETFSLHSLQGPSSVESRPEI